MNEIVERVARALCETDGYDPDELEPGSIPYGDETERFIDGQLNGGPAFLFWRVYVPKARAAIAVMHEPTEVLAIAAFNEIDTEKLTWEEDLAAFWSAAFEGFK